MSDKLSTRQRIFAEQFLKLNFNLSAAAKAAGYSQNNATSVGISLLKNLAVKEYIDKRKDQLIEEIGVTQLRVLKELAWIAFADVRDFYDETGALRNINDLPDGAAAALMCVDVFELYTQDGKKVGETKRVRTNDKLRALELLGKFLGIFEKDNKQLKPELNLYDVTLNIT